MPSSFSALIAKVYPKWTGMFGVDAILHPQDSNDAIPFKFLPVTDTEDASSYNVSRGKFDLSAITPQPRRGDVVTIDGRDSDVQEVTAGPVYPQGTMKLRAR